MDEDEHTTRRQVDAAADEIAELQAEVAVMRTACDRWEQALKRSDEARREAVAATRRLLRSALLEEAAQWTGDYRVPVHRALCDAAKRAHVPLTMDDCYQATKRACAR